MHASVRLVCFFAISALFLGIAAADGQPLLTPPTLPSTPADTTPIEPSPTEPAGDKRTENTRLLRLAQRKMETNAADNTAAQQVAHFQSVDAVFAQQDVVEQQIKDLTARKLDLEAAAQIAARRRVSGRRSLPVC